MEQLPERIDLSTLNGLLGDDWNNLYKPLKSEDMINGDRYDSRVDDLIQDQKDTEEFLDDILQWEGIDSSTGDLYELDDVFTENTHIGTLLDDEPKESIEE
jgi:hypothetical protein